MSIDIGIGAKCEVDDDCSIGMVCISEFASWNRFGRNYCDCNPIFGWTGEDCMSLSGRSASSALGVVVILFVSVYMASVLSSDLSRYLREFKGQLRFNAVLLTLCTTCAGLWLTALWRIIYFVQIIFPHLNSRINVTGTKVTNILMTITRPVQFLQASLLFVTLLTVSVIWVEVAQASRYKQPQMIDNVKRYRRGVWFVEILFVTFNVICAILGLFDLVTFLSTPYILLLIALFSYGRYRMIQVLGSLLDTRDSSDAKRKTKQALSLINSTGLLVIAGLVFMLLSGSAYFLLQQGPSKYQEFANPDKFSFLILSGFVLTFAMAHNFVVVGLYVHLKVVRILAQREHSRKLRMRRASSGSFRFHPGRKPSFETRRSPRDTNLVLTLKSKSSSGMSISQTTSIASNKTATSTPDISHIDSLPMSKPSKLALI